MARMNVLKLDWETGEILESYTSIKKAEDANKLKSKSLGKALRENEGVILELKLKFKYGRAPKPRIKKNASVELKTYCLKRRQEGMSLEQIKSLLLLKGYEVHISTISYWISTVENELRTSRVASEYELALRKQYTQQKLFEKVKQDDVVKVKGELGTTRELKVLSKTSRLLVCIDEMGFRECVNKFDLLNIVEQG